MLKKKKKKPEHSSGVGQYAIQTAEQVENEIKKFVDKLGTTLNDKQREDQLKALKEVFIDGKLPREAMGFGPDFTEQLYSQAYSRYNGGLYKEANEMFRLLCLLEPNVAKHHLGLAATNHQMGNYEIAATIYFVSWFCDTQCPSPLFYCADCFLKMDQPGSADYVLRLAHRICGNQEVYASLKENCAQMIKSLEEKHGIKPKQEEQKEEKKEVKKS